MPAETHQKSDDTDAAAVLDLLAAVAGIDSHDAATVRLADLELDDDLSILHLWAMVAEEYGERALGDLDFDGERPATLGGLAELFVEALQR